MWITLLHELSILLSVSYTSYRLGHGAAYLLLYWYDSSHRQKPSRLWTSRIPKRDF
jgi:hypothetical protein